MSQTKKRGSSKLAAMSADDLRASIQLARSSYKIERWWKYGQPQIDRIEATLNVSNVKVAPQVIGDLIGRHGGDAQVSVDVFPYGIPVLDGVRIHVNLDTAIR